MFTLEIKEAGLDNLELHSISGKVIILSPSFRFVHYPDVALVVEMLRTNLQMPVWSRHFGVPPWPSISRPENTVSI